jgi:nucleoside-diphosphate-sugar epimerase
MKQKQRIVILGASGFIGYHLSIFLSNSDHYSLVLVDNFIQKNQDQLFINLTQKYNVDFCNMDLSRDETFNNLFSLGDIVINCAAFNGTNNFYENPVSVIHNTAINSILAAEAAAQAKVKLYIYFGSSESYAGGFEYGLVSIPSPENVPFIVPDLKNPRWSYGASKTIGEISTFANHIQFGLNYIVLRIHNMYGPRMGNMHVIPNLIKKFLNDDGGVYGFNETRSFMYVDDLVYIVDNILKDQSNFVNDVYNIGSTHEIIISDLANIIRKLLNKNFEIYDFGNLFGSVPRRCPDTSLIQSKIRYTETSLKLGLETTINWYLKNL